MDVGAVSSWQPNGGCGKCKEFAQCMSFRNTHATSAYIAVHEHLNDNSIGNDHCESDSCSEHQHRYHGQLESKYEGADGGTGEKACA